LVFGYVSLLFLLVKKTGKRFPAIKFLLGIWVVVFILA
jgi:hypothetical protein